MSQIIKIMSETYKHMQREAGGGTGWGCPNNSMARWNSSRTEYFHRKLLGWEACALELRRTACIASLPQRGIRFFHMKSSAEHRQQTSLHYVLSIATIILQFIYFEREREKTARGANEVGRKTKQSKFKSRRKKILRFIWLFVQALPRPKRTTNILSSCTIWIYEEYYNVFQLYE